MFCPICGKKMIEKKALDKPLYYCGDCDFLTKGRSITSTLEKKRYDMHICDDGYLKYMAGVYEKIKDYLLPGRSLDFGCGRLHALSDILNRNGHLSDYYDKYYYSDLPKNKYNQIILIEVIEHILDLNDLFSLLDKLLLPNGRLIIMTNFIPKDIESWWYLRDETHVNFYSDRAFKTLANKYNYRVIDSNFKNFIVLQKID